jgi:inner membrane transporter RhtA
MIFAGWRRPALLPPGPLAQGVAMVLVATVSVQLGGALAVLLFRRMDPLAVVSVRLAVSAVILLAVCRPRLRTLRRTDWMLLASFGVSIVAMLGLLYLALERIPLGLAITLEVLGPLTLSVLTGRRAVIWLWAGLAAAGVFLLGRSGLAGLDVTGMVLALLAGAVWAGYIMLNARAAHRFPKAEGLAVAMAIGAVICLPVGASRDAEALLDPVTVALVAGVAVVSTVVPYTLENLALRSVPTSTFAILMSLDPAVAAAAGFIVLGQGMDLTQILAVLLVMAANIGVVTTRAAREPAGAGAL